MPAIHDRPSDASGAAVPGFDTGPGAPGPLLTVTPSSIPLHGCDVARVTPAGCESVDSKLDYSPTKTEAMVKELPAYGMPEV
ncbi:hypothetical protein GCM10026982_48990 [Nocardiopsis aegyptia]